MVLLLADDAGSHTVSLFPVDFLWALLFSIGAVKRDIKPASVSVTHEQTPQAAQEMLLFK